MSNESVKILSSAKISDVIDKYADIVDEIKEHKEQISMLNVTKSGIECDIRRIAEATGLDKFDTDRISVSIAEKQVANFDPECWDSILRWCLDNDLTDVVQRRLTAAKLHSLAQDGVVFPAGLAMETIENITYRRKGS